MDHLRPVIRTIAEAEAMYAKLLDGAARTAEWLRGFSGNPIMLLNALRFDPVGHDPLTGERLNVVEQLNQTFTILVTLRAIERLIELHPAAEGFRLALGTSSGRDIESVAPDYVAAEVFSPTKPTYGGVLRPLGEDVTEILEYVPGSFRVIRHVRPKLSCRSCEAITRSVTTPGVSVATRRCSTPGITCRWPKGLDQLSLPHQNSNAPEKELR